MTVLAPGWRVWPPTTTADPGLTEAVRPLARVTAAADEGAGAGRTWMGWGLEEGEDESEGAAAGAETMMGMEAMVAVWPAARVWLPIMTAGMEEALPAMDVAMKVVPMACVWEPITMAGAEVGEPLIVVGTRTVSKVAGGACGPAEGCAAVGALGWLGSGLDGLDSVSSVGEGEAGSLLAGGAPTVPTVSGGLGLFVG